jgi:Domain of unknown function (DUF3291)
MMQQHTRPGDSVGTGALHVEVCQPPSHHLAQLNVSRMLDTIDSPRLAEFKANIDRVYAIAERFPGFVWRLKDETYNLDSILPTPDPLFLINLSIWETPAQLEQFVWTTLHKRFYQKKSAWFEPLKGAHFVMWWIVQGHLPTPVEALNRLAYLRMHGPSQHAFGWANLPGLTLWRSQRCT